MTGCWTRRGLVVALAAVAMARPGQAKGDARAMDAFDESKLRVDLVLEPGEGYLAAAYRLVNGGAVPVVVFDRLFATDPRGMRTVDPDLCWRWVDGAGDYVIAKLLPSVPRGMRVESPEIPYARGVPAGAAVQGRAVVPLPLDQYLPYGRKAPVPPASEVGSVRLVLGYAVVDAEFAYTTVDTPEGPVLSVRPPWARCRHRLLHSAAVAGNLPLARS